MQAGLSGEAAKSNAVNIVLSAKKIAEGLGVTECEVKQANTGPREVKLYFMLVRNSGDNADQADSVVWEKTKVDLLGPNPPTGLTVGTGEQSLIVSFEPTKEQDVLGYNVYCEPTESVST